MLFIDKVRKMMYCHRIADISKYFKLIRGLLVPISGYYQLYKTHG
jgi:hypothetical protein